MEEILKILFKSRKEMEKKEEILKIAQEGRENLSNIQETMKELMEYKDMDQIHEILKECGLALMSVCRFEPINARMDELLKILLKNRRKEAQIERILKNVEEGKENLTHIQNLMRELVENWNGDETTTAKKWVLFNFNFFFMRKRKYLIFRETVELDSGAAVNNKENVTYGESEMVESINDTVDPWESVELDSGTAVNNRENVTYGESEMVESINDTVDPFNDEETETMSILKKLFNDKETVSHFNNEETEINEDSETNDKSIIEAINNKDSVWSWAMMRARREDW